MPGGAGQPGGGGAGGVRPRPVRAVLQSDCGLPALDLVQPALRHPALPGRAPHPPAGLLRPLRLQEGHTAVRGLRLGLPGQFIPRVVGIIVGLHIDLVPLVHQIHILYFFPVGTPSLYCRLTAGRGWTRSGRATPRRRSSGRRGTTGRNCKLCTDVR